MKFEIIDEKEFQRHHARRLRLNDYRLAERATRYLESVGVKLPKGGLYIHSGLFLFGWYSRHLAAKFKSMTKTAEIEK